MQADMDVSVGILQPWMPAIHAGMTTSVFIFCGRAKIMNHFVVYSLATSIYFWSLVRANLPVDAMPATPLHP